MRVLQVISKSEHGGAQTQVALLTAGLIDAGHAVTVAASGAGPLLDNVGTRGAETEVVEGLASSNPVKIARAIRSIRTLIQSVRPDIVHCHSSHAGLVTRVAAASVGTPCVFTAHGLPFKRGVRPVRRLATWIAEVLLARFPATVICVNEHEHALARRWLLLPDRRLSVIPTAVSDRPQPLKRDDSATRRPIIGTVCRLASPKRIDVLIGAMSLLTRPATLSVVGAGPELEELIAFARSKSVHVDFLGDRDDVADILESFDLFVICSDHEGAPVSVLEAMRAGLPVVASDLPGVREQLGSTGVFAPNDPGSFARQMDALLGSDARRTAVGTANRRRYTELFTADAMVKATVEVYEEVLHPAGTASRSSNR